jgi:KUP system potassium uptake protein
VGAIGVVFGDIGTSPLYALKESFIGHHPLAVDRAHIFGVLSLIFWTMMLIVTIKYVFVILKADNKGEGGSLALLALIGRRIEAGRWSVGMTVLGLIATALFYGDAIITPAVSVLSAVEGLTVVHEAFAELVLPISIAILIALFAIQSRGTAVVARLFGPVMLVYFAVLAVLGAANIAQAPEVLGAVNPIHALRFFLIDPALAFLALGSVVLAVTGAEALYADMGHFGRKAIMVAWLWVAFPACSSTTSASRHCCSRTRPWWKPVLPDGAGLGAAAAGDPGHAGHDHRQPGGDLGAFSISQQAVQLGFLPRIRIRHTSASAAGRSTCRWSTGCCWRW